MQNKKHEISEEHKQQIQESFDLFDTENEGVIDAYKLKRSIKALGFDITKAELNKVLNECDKDETGHIAFPDYYNVMSKMILNRNPTDEIKKAFKLFDDDDTGAITIRNLKRVAKELGESMSDDDLKAMIKEFDKDGDDQINFQEFLNIMSDKCSR